jgi:hypothetical protein
MMINTLFIVYNYEYIRSELEIRGEKTIWKYF